MSISNMGHPAPDGNRNIMMVAGAQTMSSREIAELCEKRHDHVLRDVREMLVQLYGEEGVPRFGGSYMTAQNKAAPEYLLPKRECLILVSGYSVDLRAKIIDRWQELEAKQASPAPDLMQVLSDPVKCIQLLTEHASKRIEAERRAFAAERIAVEKSEKAAGFDRLSNADGLYTAERAGAHFGMSGKKMNKELARLHWIYPRGPGRWLAHVEKLRQGLLEYKSHVYPRPDGTEGCKDQVMITPAGLAKLWTLLRPSEPPPPDLFGPSLAAE